MIAAAIVSCTPLQSALLRPLADMTERERVVRFSPFVVSVSITLYSSVYGRHPREFDFGARGEMLNRSVTQPRVHSRERRARTITDPDNRSTPPSLLAYVSKEEECKGRADRLTFDQSDSRRLSPTPPRTRSLARPGSSRSSIARAVGE